MNKEKFNYKELEERLLSERAAFSKNSRGRLQKEDDDELRSPYQKDRDRIIHSKAFRRLQYKTQVFMAPKSGEIRTRLTHSLEVSQISRTIARSLLLNEDLTEAIALGHDLGHPPFGHTGEEILNEKIKELKPELNFEHAKQSLRIVDLLETRERGEGGKIFGLNLSFETRNGIYAHTKGLIEMKKVEGRKPLTLEGQIVRIVDRIAYVNHDLDDALRIGLIKINDIPDEILNSLGDFYSKRIETMVCDVIGNSFDSVKITMSKEIETSMDNLMLFLKERLYLNSPPKKEEEKSKRLLNYLFEHYYNHPERLKEYLEEHPITLNFDSVDSAVLHLKENKSLLGIIICDYISSLTDRMALDESEILLFPKIFY